MARAPENPPRAKRRQPPPAGTSLQARKIDGPPHLPAPRATLWSALLVALFGAALWLGLLAILKFSNGF